VGIGVLDSNPEVLLLLSSPISRLYSWNAIETSHSIGVRIKDMRCMRLFTPYG
jgi:hypothetical protein